MTQIVIALHRRFYRPWIAPFGFWLCFGVLMFINALTALVGL